MSSVLSSTRTRRYRPPVTVGDVADHVALEVAGRGLHRRDLGALDRAQRRLEHAVAALRGAPSCSRQTARRSASAGDLLGIDGVVLDPRAGVRLVVAGAFEGGLLVADLDLEALARSRLLGDRPERLERARLLLDLEGGTRRAASAASRAAPCRPARRAGRSAGPSGRRAPPRARAGPRPPARSSSPSVPSCCSVSAPPGRAPPPSRSARAGADRSRRRAAAPASGSCGAASSATTRRGSSPMPATAAPRYSGGVPRSTIPSVASDERPDRRATTPMQDERGSPSARAAATSAPARPRT